MTDTAKREASVTYKNEPFVTVKGWYYEDLQYVDVRFIGPFESKVAAEGAAVVDGYQVTE